METLVLVLCVFAVYRVSTDMAWMTGPFHLYELIRGFMIQKFGLYHWISEGFQCPICLSFWVSMPIIYFYGVLEWLAVAGAVSVLTRLLPPRD